MEFKTKPCPVCGGKSLQVIAVTKGDETRYFVRCMKCGHEGPFSLRSDLEAKGAWNGCVDVMEYQNAKPATRKTILDAAEKCVCNDRQDQYGKPEDSSRKRRFPSSKIKVGISTSGSQVEVLEPFCYTGLLPLHGLEMAEAKCR